MRSWRPPAATVDPIWVGPCIVSPPCLPPAQALRSVKTSAVGEAAVGVIYSGEMLYLQELAEGKDFNLEYVIPKEGTNLWIDSWVIPKNAKNKENAEKWIDFLCRPDIAKRNFEYITYATPNRGAFELLDEDLQQNKAVFPDWDSLENAEVYQYLGEEADSLYNELWKEVKSN